MPIGKIAAVRRLTKHVKEIELTAGPLDFLPGQWLSLRLPIGDRPPLNRAYTLAAPPSPDGKLVLCFDRVEGGLGSGYLWEREPGDEIEFTGPHGNFTLPEETGNLLLVAHYTGIVPFWAMLKDLEASGTNRRTLLVYGIPSEEEAPYRDEVTALTARCPWLETRFVLSPDAESGAELPAIAEHADRYAPFTPFVCGVRPFTKPVRDFLMERYGFDRRAVKVEHFN